MTGRFLTGGDPRQIRAKPWYRQRRYQLPIVAIVVVAAFLTDRYDNYTPTQRGGQLVSFDSAIKQDLSTCVDGVTLAVRDWQGLGASPSPGSAGHAAGVAKAAEANCTPVSNDAGVYNLEGLQVPGALSGEKQLALAVYDLNEWAYPNAAKALLDIEDLDLHPSDAATRAALGRTEATMADERTAADGIIAAAAKQLGTHVTTLGLPSP